MKRWINSELLKKWVTENGFGPIEDAGLSVPTIYKMAYGGYKSQPKAITRKAICETTGIPESDLFPCGEEDEDSDNGPEAA